MNWGIIGNSRCSHKFVQALSSLYKVETTFYSSSVTQHSVSKSEIAKHDYYYIASRSDEHYLDLDKIPNQLAPILIEKPLDCSNRFIDFSPYENIVENIWLRFHPLIQAIQSSLSKIGEIQIIQMDMGIELESGDWRRKIGGVLYDLGVYPLHFLQLISFSSNFEIHINKSSHKSYLDEIYLELHSDKNQLARIHLSFDSWSQWECQIQGSTGDIVVHPNLWDCHWIETTCHNNEVERVSIPRVDQKKIAIEGFLETIRCKELQARYWQDSLRVQNTLKQIESLYR